MFKIELFALISVNKGFEILFDGKINPLPLEFIEEDSRTNVLVKFNSFKELFYYTYMNQLANDVSILLDRKKDIDSLVLPSFFYEVMPADSTFKILSKVGYDIARLFKDYKVDLKNPDFNIYLKNLKDEFFLTLDISGDLSVRDYKIFNTPLSLKGTTAFGVLMLSGYSKGKSLLNPLCNSGVLEIEAALYNSGISPKHYNIEIPFKRLNVDFDIEKFFSDINHSIDSTKVDPTKIKIVSADPLLKNITAAKKNAKIAGVEKYIDFRRIDIDWMDIKHDENAFDFIITFIPGSSKNKNINTLMKEFDTFFYNSEYILKKTGVLSILCISRDLLLTSASKYFELREIKNFYSGTQLMNLLLLNKRK
ncbi:MAG: hypothetical protein KatS3mg002_0106 [Candidatus Woesearchaeota archaeon]|nr:MAG: hypothetical protein KatS3mg002_0106 [Candidatus Woesearchaeota archaeon]